MSWTRHAVAAEEAGRTVQEILTGPMGVSRRMIQRLTRAAGIRLNGRAAFLGRKVRAGDVVSARLAFSEDAGLPPVAMSLSILYEDDAVLVVDKPAGILVHPVGRETEATLAHGVAEHVRSAGGGEKARPVHRLDRNTSGLVLFARSAHIHQVLDRQLRDHSLGRTYLAFVQGSPAEEEGTVDAPIGAHPQVAQLRAIDVRDGEPAITRWRLLERYPASALLEVRLETGRTHQIRVHLSHLGYPVLGDVQYGAARRTGLRRQALHASRLEFGHPLSGERIVVESPLPDDLARLREILRR